MNTQKITLTFICLTLSVLCFADISFRNYDLNKAKGVAKIEKRNIIVSYSADWCLPCKLLEQGAFQDARLTSFMNQEFVNIKAHDGKSESKEWIEEYKIVDLPVILILNNEGKVLKKLQGLMTTEILYNTFQQFKDGAYPLNPIDYQAEYIKKHNITNLDDLKNSKKASKTVKVNSKQAIVQFSRESSYKKAKRKKKKLARKNIHTVIVEEKFNGMYTYALILDEMMDFSAASVKVKTYETEGVDCYLKTIVSND